MRGTGDHYGTHRVLIPPSVFPQAAEKLDTSLPIYSNEILIRVERLNIDSAGFRQLKDSVSQSDVILMQKKVAQLVATRGKFHNPVTNSGGTLLGTVEEVGKNVEGKGFARGDRVATLVSLSLTPLHLDAIDAIDMDREQIAVKGHAILFESGIAHRLPQDLPENISLAIFDVCGAPALTAHVARPGETVVVLGAGKAGLLAAAEARKKVGRAGKVFVLEWDEKSLEQASTLPYINAALPANATDPRGTMDVVSEATEGRMADLVVNCVNIPKTEMASILAAKRSGTVLFFNMATNFQAAVLGAEGIGHETRLLMGNGYYPGHADLALHLVRDCPELKVWFEQRFGEVF